VRHCLIFLLTAVYLRVARANNSINEEYLGISRWGEEVTAMRPYSLGLRERVAVAIDHHDGPIRWIARVFRVSTPDYTPIEEMFSKDKQGLRRAEARTRAGLEDAVDEALRRATPQDILGWFRHAGLCATPG
jgi:hypothetical protein